MTIAALNSTHVLRSKILKWMCFCLSFVAAAFTYFNVFINNFLVLGILEGVFAVYCFFIYITVSSKKVRLWQSLSICLFLALLVVFGSYLAAMKNALFVWMLVLPIAYYLLMGVRWGASLSCLTIVLEGIVLFSKPDLFPFAALNLGLNLSLGYLLIWVLAHVFESSRENSYKQLQNLALLDPLTGTGNRLAMNHIFETELVNKLGLYTLVMDLDFFKRVNDVYGHAVGDKVLVAVTQILRDALPDAHVFRIGGEEFAIFIYDCSFDEAKCSAQMIRSSIEAHPFLIDDQTIALTVSVGVAQYKSGETLKYTIKAADDRLYEAKRNGRNQVVMPPEDVVMLSDLKKIS
ncbi:GGDEF domain-containing protein [Pseudoalteromonas atlantica]|uniref:GGDEF domain-containing protein n=1 Tax=Pseudoalteromonas atlantica TaxID=288 RepID=UPI003736DC58